jgi:protein-S-isoprenylcysteine O-methyltransferase Ste14
MMDNALLQCGSPPSAGVRICQAVLNIVVLLLFALCAYASYQHFLTSRSMQSFGILAVNALFLGLFLARRPAAEESPSLSLWLLGIAGTALPLLLRPSDAPGLVRIGTLIQITGMLMIAAGLLSLRRSFAVVPANRGICVGGLYRIVRHPIYISELVAVLGAVLVSPTPLNWLLWLCECGLQVARARAEENLLSRDPAYCAYRARVRYRLIPGVI